MRDSRPWSRVLTATDQRCSKNLVTLGRRNWRWQFCGAPELRSGTLWLTLTSGDARTRPGRVVREDLESFAPSHNYAQDKDQRRFRIKGELVNPCLPGNWPLKRCACACVWSCLTFVGMNHIADKYCLFYHTGIWSVSWSFAVVQVELTLSQYNSSCVL